MPLFRVIAVCLACWLPRIAAAQADVYAVVIGVNEVPDYRPPGRAAVRPLRGAESDAVRIAEILKSRFGIVAERLFLRLGKEATRQAVIDALATVARAAGPGDTVLFHFSGHGTQVPDLAAADVDGGDEADGLDEALCLYDTSADGAGLMTDDEVGRLLDRISANDIVVVLDCCHAGTGAKALAAETDNEAEARFLRWATPAVATGEPIGGPKSATPSHPSPAGSTTESALAPWPELLSRRKSLSRRVDAFFACRPEQSAYEWRLPGETARAGLFSHFLWSGAAGERSEADVDADGVVSRREAIDYAVRRLDEDFNRDRPEPHLHQTPMFQAGGIDIPFLPGMVSSGSAPANSKGL
jgi:hypothetical protein